MEKLINEFSFGLFFWHLLIFIGLIFLLKKYAWKPILDSINERDESIRDALSKAEIAKKEMEILKSDNEKIMKEAILERDKILKEGNNKKNEIISQAKEAAKKEAEKILKDAQVSIDLERKAAMKDLKDQIAIFSIDIAKKIVNKDLSKNSNQEDLINTYLDDINSN
ncbi:MAG: F0F1 ATP synthase subunit B [Bacteroidota bacterium]|jgi:F-type H+-transporting ATPase subunit b|nr:ATP synthase F0 subunit B [Flavobacteriaceae bacterium]MEC8615004.1 F0F1 ATP synthase subunit B [Bacteroidota bacterium]|tara:strand:- start:3027 stop:3527 length:501 start_codon:yes stop_codon:yes gene_type:complete